MREVACVGNSKHSRPPEPQPLGLGVPTLHPGKPLPRSSTELAAHLCLSHDEAQR